MREVENESEEEADLVFCEWLGGGEVEDAGDGSCGAGYGCGRLSDG